MSKRARPWYRSMRQEWYVTYRGKQIPLGIQDPEALGAAQEAAEKAIEALEGRPLGEAVEDYLAQALARGRMGAAAHSQAGWFLRQFLKAVDPSMPLKCVTVAQVERSAVRATWGQATRRGYLGSVGTFLRECGHELKIRRPGVVSRGADAVWTSAEWERMYAVATGDFRPYLVVLRATGARPSEIAGLTVEAIDWGNGLAVLKRHKTSGRGKARVIHFNATAQATLQEQRAKYGAGLVFRTELDGAFTMHSLSVRCARARRRAGIARAITLYGLRHTWSTRALELGASAEQVAAATGNSPAMVNRHYSHITQSAKMLKELAERVG